MKFKGLEKREPGRFITRYNLFYQTEDGQEKVYEIVSRNRDLHSLEDLRGSRADAVVMILHSADRSRVLLTKEFRMAAGEWIFSFPAGLIEPGESVPEAAARELREETGLHLDSVDEILPVSYNAIGISNEKNIFVTGTASGTITGSDSVFEEIQAAWYTREEVMELMRTEHFAGRTQLYCLMWSREKH